jgi:hypothetical protein
MFTLIRAARSVAVVCLSAATFFAASTTTTAAAVPTSNDKLLAMLSGGYTPADCTVSNRDPDPFRARLGCGPNTQPGGPRSAIYSLYATGADLTEALQSYASSGSPIACPGQVDPASIGWEKRSDGVHVGERAFRR